MDEDWLTGLQGFAEKASSERMQRLFGRILAGEIRRPGSFSLFTLDVVSKLSPQDAANIVKIAPFVVGDILMREPIVPPQIDYVLKSALSGISVINPAIVALNIEWYHESKKYDFLQLRFQNKYTAPFKSGDKIFYYFQERYSSPAGDRRLTAGHCSSETLVISIPPPWRAPKRCHDTPTPPVACLRMASRMAWAMGGSSAPSRKVRPMRRVAAGVAREVNNPLGGMLNCVDTIRRHPDQPELLARYFPLIEKGLNRIYAIVQALLADGWTTCAS